MADRDRTLIAADLTPRQRYHLMTSLVVPRPIAWVGSRSASGVANVAPFSYFAALSAKPMMIGVSIGMRRDGSPKDTLANIRATGEFTVSLVTLQHLESMNASAASFDPGVSEFDSVGIPQAEAESVAAPYVADAPASLECRRSQEIVLGTGATVFVIGEVIAVRLRGDLRPDAETGAVDVTALHPIGRLHGSLYAPVNETISIDRPATRRATDDG
jgi:flavin reductase (DIM6/NTAB) family NADH-FMN oxidoreductase RutF